MALDAFAISVEECGVDQAIPGRLSAFANQVGLQS